MVFEIFDQSNNRWMSLTPYIKYQGLEGSRNDIDGPNAGRVISNAYMYRARLAIKKKFTITTAAISNDVAREIERVLEPEYVTIRTDYFSTAVKTYEAYSNNVTKTYVINRRQDMVKLSFPIVER